MSANDAHHWRRGKGVQYQSQRESRRPLPVPGRIGLGAHKLVEPVKLFPDTREALS